MPSPKTEIRVALSVTNCICHDQRVLKMASVLKSLGCEVELIGRQLGECCRHDPAGFRIKRFRMLFKKGFLFYMFFNIRLFFYLLFRDHRLIVANDLDTLLPGYLVSRIRKVPLVFDSHEYFTGVPEVQNRPFVRYVWKTIERSVVPHLRYMITVSSQIASRYAQEYRGVRPVVIRNCAVSSEDIIPVSRMELGTGADKLLIILQGTGINAGRGGEELIEAVAATRNIFLLVVGSGGVIDMMKEKTKMMGIDSKVKYIHVLPWVQLMRYTRAADIGVTLDKNTSLNHQFSLPNKLFDYISAGIAVLASDLPEIRIIISGYHCGVLIDEVTPGNISGALNELDRNRAKLMELRKNASAAAKDLNWKNESKKVYEFYLKILKENGYF